MNHSYPSCSVRTYAPSDETHWEIDANGVISVGLPARAGGSDEHRTAGHLFAASILTGLVSAFKRKAAHEGLLYERIEGRCEIHAGPRDEGRLWIERCEVDLTIGGCIDPETARELIDAASEACVVCTSITPGIDVRSTFE